MKKFVLAFTLLLVFSGKMALSQDSGIGLGLIVGEPTGISMKTWQGASTAFDFGLAWSFSGKDFIQLHGDYLSHNFSLLKVEKGRLPFYYGIGGRLKFIEVGSQKGGDSRTRLGVRLPLGLNYLFEKTALDAFVEVVPVLDLVPETKIDLNAAIGIRYFFSK